MMCVLFTLKRTKYEFDVSSIVYVGIGTAIGLPPLLPLSMR